MRFLVVNNVSSGQGADLVHDFIRALGTDGDEIVMRITDGTTPVSSLVPDAIEFDRVIVAGGDGTVSTIVYELRDTGIPILPFPSGTGNLLVGNLDLPITAPALADVAKHGVPVRFDLGEIEVDGSDGRNPMRQGFAIIAGAGYDATVMEGAIPFKQQLGYSAYLASALVNPIPTYAKMRLRLDDETVEHDGIATLFVNFGRLQFDLQVTPDNDPRDGLLEIVVATAKTNVGLLPTITSMMLDPSGQYLGRGSKVQLFKARTAHLEADPPLSMQFDGETTEIVTPFTVRTLPGAATLIVAKGSIWA